MTRPLVRRLAAWTAAAGVLAGGLLGAVPAEAGTLTGTTTTRTAIRSTASAKGVVLGTLERGQRIPTTKKAVHGWVKVRFRAGTAYVAAPAITTRTTGLPAAPTRLTGTKIATARLNVRARAAGSGTLVGRIDEGASLRLTGTVRSGYAETTFAGHRRWVSVRYLATAAKAPTTKPDDAAQKAVAYARAQLGKPYRYGAAGPTSFDCSGLTSSAWKAAGVAVPRTSQQQFAAGREVAKADLRPGDLVFFYGAKPSHVAIYVGDGQIIHAPRAGRDVEYSKVAFMPYSGARRPG
ncbi:Cell wall-associated hydrolase, NlpC family [Friedmanniella luteola]|uniref:Cell wall-associated hydrolase, NlpC family n=1 Tax=Friedmanniella luteola TaxID=546871 RepID=A0A1H1XGA2_9ACTN|nr:C40 family peptidase [Friedmanniella luteola]SDT08210.1 Cell wall-associated hydrolase, NlpC family [Friedmanniella luteola]